MKNGHLDDGLLQDLVEGLLELGVEKEAREHLAACRECRREYEAIAELMGGLTELPGEAQPGRDLWPQIAWRIENRAGVERDRQAAHAEHPRTSSWDAGATRRSGTRRFTLTAWQLLAASIAVALISGSAVWAFLGELGGRCRPPLLPPPLRP